MRDVEARSRDLQRDAMARIRAKEDCAASPIGLHQYKLDTGYACIHCGLEIPAGTAAEATVLWQFDAPVGELTEIRCPWMACGAWVPVNEWGYGTVDCPSCGTHATIRCPRCGSEFDHVQGPVFETREPTG